MYQEFSLKVLIDITYFSIPIAIKLNLSSFNKETTGNLYIKFISDKNISDLIFWVEKKKDTVF